jgi:cytochrome c biogenesis protein CcdA/thiol-disulfide isomerase/thioredoxin
MELLILFALIAGAVTVLSPCVLPVLPILLATSGGGGRLRPVGIVLGLAITFTAVTLAVTAGAQALALPASWLRIFAIAALGFFGLTLLLPPLGLWTERALSPLVRLAGARPGGSNFWGGMAIGAGLGLVWAPCAGPIMASVLSLTALAGVTPAAVAITLAYCLGAGLPMLALAYGGRRLLSRTNKLGPGSVLMRRIFGGLTMLTCLGLFLGADAQLQTSVLNSLPPAWSATLTSIEQREDVQAQLNALHNQPLTQSTTQEMSALTAPTREPMSEPTMEPAKPTALPTSTPQQPSQTKIDLPDLGPAPELTGITQWFNSEPLALQQLRGKVVIVDFWTFDCINCRHTMPYVKDLYSKYHSQGLEIVGVHTPELSFEYVPDNVKAAIKDQGISWPVAFDPNYKTWGAYNNMYWPAFYFVDVNGHIRYTHFGEGNYDINEQVVRQLLTEVKGQGPAAGAQNR